MRFMFKTKAVGQNNALFYVFMQLINLWEKFYLYVSQIFLHGYLYFTYGRLPKKCFYSCRVQHLALMFLFVLKKLTHISLVYIDLFYSYSYLAN